MIFFLPFSLLFFNVDLDAMVPWTPTPWTPTPWTPLTLTPWMPRAVFFSENFGGSVVFPLALLPVASIGGITPDLLRAGGSPSRDCRLGGTRYVVPSHLSYFLFYLSF